MSREVGFFNTKRLWRFHTGKQYTQGELEESDYEALLRYQEQTPMIVMRDTSSKKRWWMFRNDFYWEDDEYSAEEMRILILDRLEQREKKIKRATARVSQLDPAASSLREPIPDDVKLFVWQRDRGQCVKCGSQQNLEFDHIIPVAKGGSNTARNLQLLCENCNRTKGANLT